MKTTILIALLICKNLFAAEATSSDKFAQVRGFKVEISARSLQLDSNQEKQLRMTRLEEPAIPSIHFKSLPIANAQIRLHKGNSSVLAQEAIFRFPIPSKGPLKIFNVLHFRQEEEGMSVATYRMIEKEQNFYLIHSNSEIMANYHEVKSPREHGSGLATGRRSAGLVCLGDDCFIHREIFDIRTLIHRFIMQNNQSNLEFIRRANISGMYPQSLVNASMALENVSSMSISIGEDILWTFNFSEDTQSTLKSNPVYQSSGNSGQNPLFEGKSNLRMQPIFGQYGLTNDSFRCESDGLKKKQDSNGNYYCGTTDHL